MLFQFELTNIDGIAHYWTTALMSDSSYMTFTSYWDELFTTGILPLATTVFFNIRIYLKVHEYELFTITNDNYIVSTKEIKIKTYQLMELLFRSEAQQK